MRAEGPKRQLEQQEDHAKRGRSMVSRLVSRELDSSFLDGDLEEPQLQFISLHLDALQLSERHWYTHLRCPSIPLS